MFRGRKILGEEIRLGCQTVNSARTPTAPDSAPTFRVYTESGTLTATGFLPPTERYVVTGLFEYMLALGTLFATGRYMVRYQYAISSTSYTPEPDTFEVVGGGDTHGQFVSLAFLDRPDADWIVGQTDAGNTLINRNPHV